MILDRYSGAHATESATAVEAFEGAVWNVLAHRPAGASALAAALTHDPGMVAAHALRGFAGVLLARRETVAGAALDLQAARRSLESRAGSDSERALVAALERAVAGRLRAAAEILAARSADAPQDLLALKLAHALRFMSGDFAGMLEATQRALPHWMADQPGYGFLLGCHAFALEESGSLREAEYTGRRAIALEPSDAWGLHAVGHVLEMEGRAREGGELLEGRRAQWSKCNNFSFHMAWHLALFHLAEGDAERALVLYDRDVRPAPTDDFRDITNAVSLLWRLRQEGVPVGYRWEELADLARRRADDTTLIFASLHHLLTLIATGDRTNAERIAEQIARCAREGKTDQSDVARKIGLDLAQTLLSLGSSASARLDLERLARDMAPIGGSRAQRDVFMRTLALLAARSGLRRQVERVLEARMRLQRNDRFSRLAFRLLGVRGQGAWGAA